MAIVARIPSQEQVLDKSGLCRVPWLTFFRGQQEVLAAAPQQVTGGKVQEPSKTAAIGTTPIPTGQLVKGLYRIGWYGQVLTPAGVSSSFQVTVSWTRNTVVQSITGTLKNGNTTTTYESVGLPQIHVDAGTPVSYAVAYASNPANAMAYEFNLVLELVSADA